MEYLIFMLLALVVFVVGWVCGFRVGVFRTMKYLDEELHVNVQELIRLKNFLSKK